jgi:REP-associated tyrosine transposase
VNAAQTQAELEALRKCVNRGTAYGSEVWKTRIANALGSDSTLHPQGRPRKEVGFPLISLFNQIAPRSIARA